jgi:hypothetical protein
VRLSFAALALLAGCVHPPEPPLPPHQGPFGAEQTFTGVLRLGFERQSFDECWLDLTNTASNDLYRLAPSPALADSQASYSADVTLVGRRRNVENGEPEPGYNSVGFGHMGAYPCEIQATRITAARQR